MKTKLTSALLLLTLFSFSCKKDHINENSQNGSSTPTSPVTPVVPKATGNSVLTFNVMVSNKIIAGVIDTTKGTIIFTLPNNPGVDPGLMRPFFKVSAKATVTPDTTASKDFTTPVKYVVKAENGTTHIYTVMAVSASFAKLIPKAPMPLIIFYGIPSLVNGSTTIAQAAQFFAQFKLIVFGDHLNDPSSQWRSSTIQLISAIRALDATTQIYGYTDLGNTENLTLTQLRTSIDNWHSMGVQGVFFDEVDYAYNNTRSRQNNVINYTHGKGMHVFMNSYTIDDVLADYNGAPSLMNKTDIELLESLLVKQGTITPLSEFYQRANKAYIYMRTKGIKIAVASTIALSNLNSSSNATDAFKFAWCGTAMYNFDYFQFTDSNYSATNSNAYFFPNLTNSLGSSFKPEFDWIRPNGADEYYRSTNTNTIHIYSTGKGAISKP